MISFNIFEREEDRLKENYMIFHYYYIYSFRINLQWSISNHITHNLHVITKILQFRIIWQKRFLRILQRNPHTHTNQFKCDKYIENNFIIIIFTSLWKILKTPSTDLMMCDLSTGNSTSQGSLVSLGG